MADRVLQRRDTAANWAAANPVLMEGELGIITDGAKGYKIGDGVTAWNNLEYPANPTSVVQELGEDENAVISQKVVSDNLLRDVSTSWFKELGSNFPNLNEVSVAALRAVKDVWFSFPNGRPSEWDGYCRIAKVQKPQDTDADGTNYLLITFDDQSLKYAVIAKPTTLINSNGISRISLPITSFSVNFEINLIIDFSVASTTVQNIDLRCNINENSLFQNNTTDELGSSESVALSQKEDTMQLLARPRTSWFSNIGDVVPNLTQNSIQAMEAIKDIWFTFPNGRPTNWDGFVRVARVIKPQSSDPDNIMYFLVGFNSSTSYYVSITKADNLIKSGTLTRVELAFSGFDKPLILNAIVDFDVASTSNSNIDLRCNIKEDSLYSSPKDSNSNYPFSQNIASNQVATLAKELIVAMDMTEVTKREGMYYGLVNLIVTPTRFVISIKYNTTTSLPNATTEVYWELTGDWGFGQDKLIFLKSSYSATGKVGYLMINPKSIQQEVTTSSISTVYTGIDDNIFTIPNNYIQIELLKESGGGSGEAAPDIFLPPVLYMTKGIQQAVYYDSIMVLPETGVNPQNALMLVTGMNYNRRNAYQNFSSAGDRNLTISVLDPKTMNPLSTGNSILRVMNNSNPSTLKYILCLGDSTTDDNYTVTKTLQENLAACSGTTPEFIGTHGKAPWNHEARTGKTFSYYVNGITAYKFTVQGLTNASDDLTPLWWYYVGTDRNNGYILVNQEIDVDSSGNGYVIAEIWTQPSTPITAGWSGTLQKGGYGGGPETITVTNTEILEGYSIMKNNNGVGTLDLAYYMNKFNAGKSCDVLCIDLGVNDIREYPAAQYKQGTEQILATARQLFTSFFSYNPNGKIVLCTPKSCASDNEPIGNYTHDQYRIAMQYLRNQYVEAFYNNEFAPNIFIGPSGICYDRWYAYTISERVVAPEYTQTMEYHNDTIHLNDNGYKQVGNAMTGAVLAALNA